MGLWIVLGIDLIIGIASLFYPVKVLQIIYILPKYIFPGIYPDAFLPRVKEAKKLIEDDPELFEDQFKVTVIMIRITGVIALFIFISGLCMLGVSK